MHVPLMKLDISLCCSCISQKNTPPKQLLYTFTLVVTTSSLLRNARHSNSQFNLFPVTVNGDNKHVLTMCRACVLPVSSPGNTSSWLLTLCSINHFYSEPQAPHYPIPTPTPPPNPEDRTLV